MQRRQAYMCSLVVYDLVLVSLTAMMLHQWVKHHQHWEYMHYYVFTRFIYLVKECKLLLPVLGRALNYVPH